jgi:pimeloyl-ACP methyl ester carboxylesterase
MKIALIIGLVLLAILAGAALYLYTPDKPRAALEAKYAGPPSTFLDLDGLRLHLRDTGPRDAPAILFLHGFGSSLHSWEDWAQLLDKEFRVVRIDLPGFGLTGADPSGDYTAARLDTVLIALLDRLGIARTHLVGSSMGGGMAWGFASRHPERVAKLVLMAPDGFASPGRGYDEPPRVPPLLRILPYALPDRLFRPSIVRAYADPNFVTPTLYDRYRDLMLAPGVRRAILDRVAQSRRQDPRPQLARITLPVLLLWGGRDALIPASHAADYLAVLPDARLVTFPELGHVPMEEAPARTAAALRAFLGG